MGYWKISFESLMDIRESFQKFIDECMRGAERNYNRDLVDDEYYAKKIRDANSYMTPPEFWAKEREMKERSLALRNRRVGNIQKMIDDFTFFIDLVEFEKFTSADFGKTVVIDFHQLTIIRKNNPNIPSNRFAVLLSGIKFSYGTYDYYEFLPNRLKLQFDYYN